MLRSVSVACGQVVSRQALGEGRVCGCDQSMGLVTRFVDLHVSYRQTLSVRNILDNTHSC